jgi:uncharacterized membrane protein YbhN (UPF0104 family)
MTLRRSVVWTGSVALTVILILILIKISKLDFRVTVQQLRSVSWVAFTRLILLTGLHVFLSSQKWRCVDNCLRRSSDSAPSRTTSFGLTSFGVALGQILPVQVSMSIARTLGTYLHGRALRRGTGGTLFEQSFDVVIVGLLVIASGVTHFYRGGGAMWLLCAVALTASALLGLGPSMEFFRRRLTAWNRRSTGPKNKILRSLDGFEHSGLLNASLARQLMALSAARFIIQVLMAGETARAIGVSIPLWQLAAAMPFVVIACVLVATPGGLGVNELSYATMLHLFGTPLHVGAQWALANRFLVASSCFVVAIVAAAAMGFSNLLDGGDTAPLTPELQEDSAWPPRQ